MAEYIDRQKLLEKAKSHLNSPFSAALIIAEIEKADFVEVVRCSKCKYKDDCAGQIVHTTRDYVLEQNISTYNKVDFCSCGERK